MPATVPADSGHEHDDAVARAPDATSIEFTGNATEYFGIWLSNTVLSILTLGIYSA